MRYVFDHDLPLPRWLEHSLDCLSKDSPCSLDALNSKISLAVAFDFAFRFHEGQFRATGEPYIVHPLAVSNILYNAGSSPSVIIAGLLHDIVEDTQITSQRIEIHFGSEVRLLVEGVTKLGKIHSLNYTEARAENLHKLFITMANDIRVVLVKLADRLHNMRTIASLHGEKQQRIAWETREIYAPLANRLGIACFQWELEDLAFKILEPDVFLKIQSYVAANRSEREFRVSQIVNLLKNHLSILNSNNLHIEGRTKHLYGLWSKMQSQQRTFEDIYDVAGLRIITPDVESCYSSLSIIYQVFCPILGRFKDYIGLPKPNGYQSLHTAVIGISRPIEMQIRTNEMHQIAEYGIASHVRYKEGGSPVEVKSKCFNWLYQFAEWQENNEPNRHSDYLALVKEDLLIDDLYVFTPKGDLIHLNPGSSAVDFAYFVNTSIGDCFQQVAINGCLCPFSTALENGDVIQVFTDKYPSPKLDWLNYLSTSTAHTYIRQWYVDRHNRDESIRIGRLLIERELGSDGLYVLLSSNSIARMMSYHGFITIKDLISALGYGEIILNYLMNYLRG
uniref:Putative GTP diphosphokinase RSH1, chloroplastic n=1 Tax=Paulinella micropora TaxID=1928728 RepID=A0A385I052_9EUKA|nr:metal dependent phosphohydrolase [Paulinella micropora]AXY63289.1 metal dependent phosphohydrolase [Paulinella micropora]